MCFAHLAFTERTESAIWKNQNTIEHEQNSSGICENTDAAAVYQQSRNPFYFDCFGEGLRLARERLDEKNVYYINPSFDR